MKRCIIIFTLLLSLVGCDIPQTGTRPGYIYTYYYFTVPKSKITYEHDTFSILLYNNSGKGIYVSGQDYAFGQSIRKNRYYELCEKFGDINPDGYPCSSEDEILTPEASFEIVQRVLIVSDNDWSTDRAAGESLNDMFTIRYFSYFPYISSRYTGAPLTSFTKPLSDLKEDEMKLIMNNIELGCATRPTAAQHHTLTVSFDLDTDRTATYEVELDFAATEAQ